MASVQQPTRQVAPTPDIIDIRGDKIEINLKEEVISMLNPTKGPRKLPTLLLYNAKGLQLFEDITYLDEYYLTNHEIEVLERSVTDMAQKIPEGAMLVELGSGNLRKISLLLQAFEDAQKKVEYYALDLSYDELQRTLAQLPDFRYVKSQGLWGTYDDGKKWLEGGDGRPRCILSLGSSIGNFNRTEAAEFIADFANAMESQDMLLIGVDACEKPEKVYHAYNDSKGVTHQFILNGLTHANSIFNDEIFHLNDWQVIGEYVYDHPSGGRHQAFVAPVRDVTILGQHIKANERVQIEQSLKYSRVGAAKLWNQAGLVEADSWKRDDGEYGIHMLQLVKMPFQLKPEIYAKYPLPTPEDWQALWQAWDTVTRRMLPDQELGDKPIKLRNACIFYLGHIPTFLDIQLSRVTGQPHTEPSYFTKIFERGIDPDVDNPERCHDHSEIPEDWPPVEKILGHQNRVRSRLLRLYENGQEHIPRSVGRAVWLGFEHELMHIETLLYMMLQSDKTLAPPHTEMPEFESLARDARESKVDNEWFDVPEQTIDIGLNDPEAGGDQNGHFGWDNEKPARKVQVPAFQAKGRAITNEEYAEYMHANNILQVPASWCITKSISRPDSAVDIHLDTPSSPSSSPLPESFLEGKSVRTVYGPVPLAQALDWPVFASYEELAACAAWFGGRIPTYEEARSLYDHAEVLRNKDLLSSKLANKFSAVNGHLINDGVEETPPSRASDSTNSSNELFIDLTGTNTGFKHWHPVSITSRGNRLAGQGDLGGVWEWTSSVLRKHEAFEPMTMYPAYTADFFDEKHNIVLGGSWATHPRIAGRKSFVNWYQRNYPYAWVGARIVRDVSGGGE